MEDFEKASRPDASLDDGLPLQDEVARLQAMPESSKNRNRLIFLSMFSSELLYYEWT